MSVLVLLLVLWVEKFSAWRGAIQQDGPWLRLLAKAERQADFIERPWLVMVLMVGLPLSASQTPPSPQSAEAPPRSDRHQSIEYYTF
jgi:membrane protein required for beta-lactamase induction